MDDPSGDEVSEAADSIGAPLTIAAWSRTGALMIYPLALLRAAFPCAEQLDIVEATWPEGIPLDDPELPARLVALRLNISWAAEHLLTPAAYAEWERVTAAAYAEWARVPPTANAEWQGVRATKLVAVLRSQGGAS